jgi:hypothetical protein
MNALVVSTIYVTRRRNIAQYTVEVSSDTRILSVFSVRV